MSKIVRAGGAFSLSSASVSAIFSSLEALFLWRQVSSTSHSSLVSPTTRGGGANGAKKYPIIDNRTNHRRCTMHINDIMF